MRLRSITQPVDPNFFEDSNRASHCGLPIDYRSTGLMKFLRIALVLCAGLAAVVASAHGIGSPASGTRIPAWGDTPAPLFSLNVGPYRGVWAVDEGRVIETYSEGDNVVSRGATSVRSGVGADAVLSFGYVGGFGPPEATVDYAQLSGQAGEHVTGVRVVSASGVTTTATLVDGIWGALWGASNAQDDWGHPVTIEFDTATGTHEVTSDEVDVFTSAAQ
jgi:hypothetical protein